MISDKPFHKMLKRTRESGVRPTIPLMGFPGLQISGGTIKLAQQNYAEHFKTIKALAEQFRPDAIFPLMDLAVEANALGRYTIFPKEESATVLKDAFTLSDLEAMAQINIASDTRLLGYVETLKLMRIGLPPEVLRGAYVTGPYTLAALIMGAEEAAMATIADPGYLREICQFTTEKIQEYIRLLIAAGAQLICILEPSAVMLGPEQFWQFSAGFIQHINRSCKYTGVATVYHTCGNTMHLLSKMAESGVDAVSLDSPEAGVDLPEAARKLPPEIMIIGNINPTGNILRGTPDEVESEVLDLLGKMKSFPNFILSTGCDLPQETPLDNIRAFMRAGRTPE